MEEELNLGSRIALESLLCCPCGPRSYSQGEYRRDYGQEMKRGFEVVRSKYSCGFPMVET